MKVPSAGSSTKRIADDKGVYREMESERSPRQNVGPTNRNRMRHTKVDKPADQGEVLSYSEPEVYMRRANDVKERALTRGGLTDDNPVDWRSKACCEKSAESIVVGPVADEGSNLLEFGTRPTKSHGAEKNTCLQKDSHGMAKVCRRAQRPS